MKMYLAFLVGVLMMLPSSYLCAQERDSIIEYYLSKNSHVDSLLRYGKKLYEYTIDKPHFSESHFISCAILLDLSPEKFDSPTNKIYIQSIYDIVTSNNPITNSERMDGFRILGDYYHQLYEVEQAIKYYHQGILISDTSSIEVNQTYLSALYTNLSNLYIDLNELEKARLLIEKIIELDIKTEGSFSEYLGIDYLYLAKTYRPIDPKKSLSFFFKAKEQFNTLKRQNIEIYQLEELKELYVLIADNYLALGNSEQGLLEIDTALTSVKNTTTKVALIHGKALKTKAAILQHRGDFSGALKQYQLADQFLKNKSPALTYKPKILLQKTRCYLAMNQPVKAQYQLKQGFTIIDQSGPPHQSRLDKVTFPIDLFHLYYEQAKVFTAQYESSQKFDFLVRAQKAYQDAFEIFEIVKHDVSGQNSRQVLMKNNAKFFELAIDLNFQIWEHKTDSTTLNTILFLFEKSKNNKLYESLNKLNSTITSTLPDSVNQQIQSIDLQISQTEKKLFQAELTNEVLVISASRDQLIRHREQQRILMQHIEKNYPHFHQLKYHNSVPTVKNLQKKLAPEEGIISYYVGINHLYVLLIDKWDFSVERMPIDFSLTQKIDEFNNSIVASTGKSAASKKALQDYHQTGFFLYQKLIAPFIRKLPSQLTILPDNVLETLSFDALLTELPSPSATFQDYPFLLKKYNISYQYSADVITRSSLKKEFQHHLLAFAPTFSDNNDFSIDKLRDFGELFHNTKEVDKIQNILSNGLVLKGKKATEESFMKLAPNYQIIHLATHGKVNIQYPDYSYLAFQEVKDSLENELLYIKDIYGLQLKADLVVLSACETANGTLAEGEGIVNLARGFTYAGASAVVSTLWKISDIATANLMEEFYRGLKNGQPKDIAMAKAKNHFLETTSSQFAHPFYWAAFVLIGDSAPISLPQSSQIISYTNVLWSGIGALIFLLLVGATKYGWTHWR